MIKQVFKYPIPFASPFVLELPEEAEIIHFASQTNVPDELCIWVIVNAEAPKENRKFFLLGTGHFFPSEDQKSIYIGTVIIQNFVWHLFEAIS